MSKHGRVLEWHNRHSNHYAPRYGYLLLHEHFCSGCHSKSECDLAACIQSDMHEAEERKYSLLCHSLVC